MNVNVNVKARREKRRGDDDTIATERGRGQIGIIEGERINRIIDLVLLIRRKEEREEKKKGREGKERERKG